MLDAITTRAPFVVAAVRDLALTNEPSWVPCVLVPGETYRLRALVAGDDRTEDNAALLRVDVVSGTGLSVSASVGAFRYLRTGPGVHRTDRVFTVDSPADQVGLAAWGNRGTTCVRSLTIERVSGADLPSSFFFSFDVEAASGRASGDPIDSLVWGRLDGGEYGIGRICDVLEQYGIRGNFLVDFATCGFEGPAKLGRIVDFLGGRGHEVHMHLHPEWLAEVWGLPLIEGHLPTGAIGGAHLDSTPYEMCRRLLEFTVNQYETYVGRPPRLFRSGAYRMSPQLILAAGSLGIEALSNARGDTIRDTAAGGDPAPAGEPFRWENGVLELPVDVSSPEAGKFQNYLARYENAVTRKLSERTFNVVMHSWSLLRRNEQGVHDAYGPDLEQRLHEMCEHATNHGRTYGYGEYLDAHDVARPSVRLARVRTAEPERLVYVPSPNIVTCNICDSVFDRSTVAGGVCPGCGAGTELRQLKQVIDTFGNVFTGRDVLCPDPSPVIRREFLYGAASVVMAAPSAGAAFGGILDLGLVGRGSDRAPALAPGGVLVTAASAVSAATGTAGRAPAALSGLDVSAMPAADPVTGVEGTILFAYQPGR
jgi:hypothetical protein